MNQNKIISLCRELRRGHFTSYTKKDKVIMLNIIKLATTRGLYIANELLINIYLIPCMHSICLEVILFAQIPRFLIPEAYA